MRALVSTRSTQVPSTLAMRAREAATPTAQDLATAEAEVVLVRRNYVPPAPLATGRRAEPAGRAAGTSSRPTGRRRTDQPGTG